MVEVTDERDIAAAKRYLTRVVQACGDTKEVKEVRPDHPAVEFAREVREAAANAERDRIVAWLREMGSIRGGVADAIEALEHLEGKQP